MVCLLHLPLLSLADSFRPRGSPTEILKPYVTLNTDGRPIFLLLLSGKLQIWTIFFHFGKSNLKIYNFAKKIILLNPYFYLPFCLLQFFQVFVFFFYVSACLFWPGNNIQTNKQNQPNKQTNKKTQIFLKSVCIIRL